MSSAKESALGGNADSRAGMPFWGSWKSQTAPAPQAANKERGMRDRLQAAAESLNLTDDQKAKVKDIFADAKTKREAVFADTSLGEDQKKAKMNELHEGTLAKLNEVLTPEQQTELKSKMNSSNTVLLCFGYDLML
jgi:Spy/CpxP family protein refolding chaperone